MDTGGPLFRNVIATAPVFFGLDCNSQSWQESRLVLLGAIRAKLAHVPESPFGIPRLLAAVHRLPCAVEPIRDTAGSHVVTNTRAVVSQTCRLSPLVAAPGFVPRGAIGKAGDCCVVLTAQDAFTKGSSAEKQQLHCYQRQKNLSQLKK